MADTFKCFQKKYQKSMLPTSIWRIIKWMPDMPKIKTKPIPNDLFSYNRNTHTHLLEVDPLKKTIWLPETEHGKQLLYLSHIYKTLTSQTQDFGWLF